MGVMFYPCEVGYILGVRPANVTQADFENRVVTDNGNLSIIYSANPPVAIDRTYPEFNQYMTGLIGSSYNQICPVPVGYSSTYTKMIPRWFPGYNSQFPGLEDVVKNNILNSNRDTMYVAIPKLHRVAFMAGVQKVYGTWLHTYNDGVVGSSVSAGSWLGQKTFFPFTSNGQQVNMPIFTTSDYTQLSDSTKWYSTLYTQSTNDDSYSRTRSMSTTSAGFSVDNCVGFFGDAEEPIIPEPPDTDPYSGIDGMGEITGGGTGTIGIPGFPPISATSTGILGLFAPSTYEMQQLSDYMWTDFGGTGATEVDVLKEIVQALKRSISNPLDYVTGLSIIPSQGLSVGSSQVIKFGFTSSGVSMARLSSQYFVVDCGSINFDTLCGDTFLDYAPYSKFSIYLPYIGCKTLDANDCVGHTIGVVYHGDVVTGGVTAYVTKDGSVMYQYSGCCSLNIPLSADSWGTTISGAVQVATSMMASASTPGVAGVAKTAIAGAANVASNPSMLSPQVEHSGAISGGAGCMGVQYPYIIREAVRFHSTQGFNREHGYPSFYYRKLSAVSGFTIVYDAHIDNINATDEEISEIEDLLRNGVIL